MDRRKKPMSKGSNHALVEGVEAAKSNRRRGGVIPKKVGLMEGINIAIGWMLRT